MALRRLKKSEEIEISALIEALNELIAHIPHYAKFAASAVLVDAVLDDIVADAAMATLFNVRCPPFAPHRFISHFLFIVSMLLKPYGSP